MNRKAQGGFTTKELVVAIAAVFVLVIVLIGVIGYLSNGVSFFKWLPGFNESSGGPVTGGGESMVFRYNLNEDKVEYYNGVQGIVYSDSEVIKLGEGKEIMFGQLKGDFVKYYILGIQNLAGINQFNSDYFYLEKGTFSSDKISVYRRDTAFYFTNKAILKITEGPIRLISSSGVKAGLVFGLSNFDKSTKKYILVNFADNVISWGSAYSSSSDFTALDATGNSEVITLFQGKFNEWRDSVLAKPLPIQLKNDKIIYSCVCPVEQGITHYLWSDLKNAKEKSEGMICKC